MPHVWLRLQYMKRGTLHDGEDIPCRLLHVKENRLKLVAGSIQPNVTGALPMERYYPHPSFESCQSTCLQI
jgi:hypothetical protein